MQHSPTTTSAATAAAAAGRLSCKRLAGAAVPMRVSLHFSMHHRPQPNQLAAALCGVRDALHKMTTQVGVCPTPGVFDRACCTFWCILVHFYKCICRLSGTTGSQAGFDLKVCVVDGMHCSCRAWGHAIVLVCVLGSFVQAPTTWRHCMAWPAGL